MELHDKVRVVGGPMLFRDLIGKIDLLHPTKPHHYRVWFEPPGVASAWFYEEELELVAG